MVFYFTGTGNSLYIAKNLDDSIFSIPKVIHDKKKEYCDKKIGIVCPIYGHEMPPLVKEFIKRTSFNTPYFYVILTYGKNNGGASELTYKYLKKYGIEAFYINTIMMVDNYLPSFDMNEQLKIDENKKVDEYLETIKDDIRNNTHYIQMATQDDIKHHQRYLQRREKDPIDVSKGIFKIKDMCVGCGICMHVCPVGCITVINQHGKYLDTSKCQMCLACIQHCPKNAICLTIPEKNPNARYHNRKIKLSELVEANNQYDF